MLDYINNMIENNNTNLYLMEGATIGLIIFTLYLELNPRLGDVWYRQDSNNIRRIYPNSLLEYFKKPFQNKILWYPQNWDLNPYTFTTLISISFTMLRKYFNNEHIFVWN